MKHYDWYDKDYGEVIAILCIILGLAISFGFACLGGWIFMAVWNNLLPLLWAEAPTISFWLAIGIIFVLRLIFKPITNISTKN